MVTLCTFNVDRLQPGGRVKTDEPKTCCSPAAGSRRISQRAAAARRPGQDEQAEERLQPGGRVKTDKRKT